MKPPLFAGDFQGPSVYILWTRDIFFLELWRIWGIFSPENAFWKSLALFVFLVTMCEIFQEKKMKTLGVPTSYQSFLGQFCDVAKVAIIHRKI
jgi:hypothetical protein